MIKLIKTEWLKMRKYTAFWWIMGLTALAYPGINYAFYMVYDDLMNKPTQASKMAKMLIGNPFTFPEVWHTVAYFSSWFVFIPAVVVIMFISNEYSFKTHRQNIIDGWSRKQFITSKLMDVMIISLLISVLYIIVCLGFYRPPGTGQCLSPQCHFFQFHHNHCLCGHDAPYPGFYGSSGAVGARTAGGTAGGE